MSIEVAIVMGSASDWDVMSNAQKMLDQFGVKAESRVLSSVCPVSVSVTYTISDNNSTN